MTDQLGWHGNSKSENKYILTEDKDFWGLIENAGQHFLALQGDSVADPQVLQTPPDFPSVDLRGVKTTHRV